MPRRRANPQPVDPAAPRRGAASRLDVARLAGVAPSTVSLVLNRTPGPRIPDATRRRVEEAALQLGYRSSAIARALVSGRTQTVGVVVHFMDHPFQSYVARVLDGAWLGLASHNYRMLLLTVQDSPCAAGLFRERCVDGLLVLASPPGERDAELHELVEARFPAVFVGSRPPLPVDYVDLDNVAAGRRTAERLLAAGHRRILHLAGPLAVNSSAVDRLAGHRQALAAAGIADDPALTIVGDYAGATAERLVHGALDRGTAFTAIAAANLAMAQGAMRALLARGRQVPAEVSLAGIDADAAEPARDGPRIATIDQPLEELGRQAGDLLLARMAAGAGADPTPRTILLPGIDIAGGSIAPPPA